MKYTNEIEIKAPIHRVIELFDNVDNLAMWQPGLISFEHLSGTAGQVGAKSKLKYRMGKRDIEMIETITKKNLPEEFSGTYEAKGVLNIISNRFIAVNENTTKMVAKNEFQFKGFMKIVSLLMPGVFKKQTQQYLEQFKTFVEAAQ